MALLYSKHYIPSDTRFVKMSETELYAIKWPAIVKKQLRKIVPIEGEIWRNIVGMPDRYFVSNLGRMKTKYTMKNSRDIEKELPGNLNGNRMILRASYKGFTVIDYVNRIVLKAFNPVPNMAKLVPIYIDGNPLNSALSNLRWGTRGELNRYIRSLGLTPPLLNTREIVSKISGKSYTIKAQFTDADTLEMIRLYKAGINLEKIASIFNCTTGKVSKYCKGTLRPDLLERFDQILQRETIKKPKEEKP